MKKPIMLRKRYIPDEVVDISGDELLFRSDELLITRWKPIKPRNDIAGGISWIFIEEGYKVSKFYDASGKFLYWYCDIIDVEYHQNKDMYVFKDLLVDIMVMSNGCMRILDMDELAEAMEKGLISNTQVHISLRRLDMLLKMIYAGKFPPSICGDRNFNLD